MNKSNVLSVSRFRFMRIEPAFERFLFMTSFVWTLEGKKYYNNLDMHDFLRSLKIPLVLPSDVAAEKKAGFSSYVKNRAQQGCFNIYFPLVP